MTTDEDRSGASSDQLPPAVKVRLLFTLAAIVLFALVFFVLRYVGVIDELPLKMGVFEGFFK